MRESPTPTNTPVICRVTSGTLSFKTPGSESNAKWLMFTLESNRVACTACSLLFLLSHAHPGLPWTEQASPSHSKLGHVAYHQPAEKGPALSHSLRHHYLLVQSFCPHLEGHFCSLGAKRRPAQMGPDPGGRDQLSGNPPVGPTWSLTPEISSCLLSTVTCQSLSTDSSCP